MTTIAAGRSATPRSPERALSLGREVAGLPWPVWGALVYAIAMFVGWNWDISWHRSIGSDSAGTAPHLAIYSALCLAFAGAAGLVFSHTLGPLRHADGVHLLGVKGPSGAFVTLWGLLLQVTALVFDGWWREVYGLDVDVFSPPHGLLMWGVCVSGLGQFGLVATWRNTSSGENERRSRWVAILLGGMFLGQIALAVDPRYGPQGLRTVFFVATTAMAIPFGLAFLDAYLGRRYAGFLAALAYVAAGIVLVQVFPLFTATPWAGPVYHAVSHLVAPPFPILLAVPALAMGGMLPGDRPRFASSRYVTAGLVFVGVSAATNWAASAVLLSPAGQSRMLGSGGFPGSVFEQEFRQVVPLRADLHGALAVATAVILAGLYSFAGHGVGRWLRSVIR
jgi:hypothetical protein